MAGGVSYYDGDIHASVTIAEANFYQNDVVVMVSKDGGAPTAVHPSWSDRSTDIHVGTFTLTGDGDYFVTINYTDKSSNKMASYTSEQMTIDTQIEAPVYTVNGASKGEQGGAYKEDAKLGFSFEDQNFNTAKIKLTRTRFHSVEDVTEEFIKTVSNEMGGSGQFEIPYETMSDGIYLLTISMTDMAKHSAESKIKFTVNRYGSVYEYSDELAALIQNGGQYVTGVDHDLVVTEYNADKILSDSLNILVTRDGEPIDVDFATSPAVIDQNASVGDSGWYQYIYTIKASNFAEDGVYKISLASRYSADDVKENESASVPENSMDKDGNQILDSMNFTVDSKAPEIRNIVNLEKSIINANSLDVKYTVVDVGGLKEIDVILNGEKVDTVKEFPDGEFSYSGQFTINESSDAQTVQLKVVDLAGNVTDTDSEEFTTEDLYVFNRNVTVSTNVFVRWYANKPLFYGSIGTAAVVVGLILYFTRRKKSEDETEA